MASLQSYSVGIPKLSSHQIEFATQKPKIFANIAQFKWKFCSIMKIKTVYLYLLTFRMQEIIKYTKLNKLIEKENKNEMLVA